MNTKIPPSGKKGGVPQLQGLINRLWFSRLWSHLVCVCVRLLFLSIMVINARYAACTFGQQNSHMCDIKRVQFLCFSCRFFSHHKNATGFATVSFLIFLHLPHMLVLFTAKMWTKRGLGAYLSPRSDVLLTSSSTIHRSHIHIYHIFPIYYILHLKILSESNTKAGMVKDVTLFCAFAMTLFCAILVLLSL